MSFHSVSKMRRKGGRASEEDEDGRAMAMAAAPLSPAPVKEARRNRRRLLRNPVHEASRLTALRDNADFCGFNTGESLSQIPGSVKRLKSYEVLTISA